MFQVPLACDHSFIYLLYLIHIVACPLRVTNVDVKILIQKGKQTGLRVNGCMHPSRTHTTKSVPIIPLRIVFVCGGDTWIGIVFVSASSRWRFNEWKKEEIPMTTAQFIESFFETIGKTRILRGVGVLGQLELRTWTTCASNSAGSSSHVVDVLELVLRTKTEKWPSKVPDLKWNCVHIESINCCVHFKFNRRRDITESSAYFCYAEAIRILARARSWNAIIQKATRRSIAKLGLTRSEWQTACIEFAAKKVSMLTAHDGMRRTQKCAIWKNSKIECSNSISLPNEHWLWCRDDTLIHWLNQLNPNSSKNGKCKCFVASFVFIFRIDSNSFAIHKATATTDWLQPATT